MLPYLIEWGHTYLVHFGSWMTFAFAATVTKKGLPQPKDVLGIVQSAVAMAAIVAIFSSHAHSHYLNHFVK